MWWERLRPRNLALVLAYAEAGSLGCGLVGSWYLANAVGLPPELGGKPPSFLTTPYGRYIVPVVIQSYWNIGVSLIALAFFLQLPRVWISMSRALNMKE